jgi:hypothetical protein
MILRSSGRKEKVLGLEVHAAGGIKGITNFDLTEYERDVGQL